MTVVFEEGGMNGWCAKDYRELRGHVCRERGRSDAHELVRCYATSGSKIRSSQITSRSWAKELDK